MMGVQTPITFLPRRKSCWLYFDFSVLERDPNYEGEEIPSTMLPYSRKMVWRRVLGEL